MYIKYFNFKNELIIKGVAESSARGFLKNGTCGEYVGLLRFSLENELL